MRRQPGSRPTSSCRKTSHSPTASRSRPAAHTSLSLTASSRDCGRMVAERKDQEGWFDVSTLKEPFRVEGKKTMGYEVAEQMGWSLPDAILYPTGGGVGLIGMWKAFEEMEELGWIKPGKSPKMISIQASGCAPIIKALDEEKTDFGDVADAHTLAAGLAGSQGLRRLHDSRHHPQERRHCRRGER